MFDDERAMLTMSIEVGAFGKDTFTGPPMKIWSHTKVKEIFDKNGIIRL